jgi:hypothetical protein
MPAAMVVDELGIGKIFTSVAAAMLCKLVTEKVVMGLPLSILWGNTFEQWVIFAHNDLPSTVGEERESYLLQRLNLVLHHLLEMQTTPPDRDSAHITVHEPIAIVTLPRVVESFKSFINEMTHRTDFKLINLLHAENANCTHEDLNNSIDKSENGWNIYLVSYDTIRTRAKSQAMAGSHAGHGVW